MKCPYCSYEESKVIDSRSADDGERIRRRRECLKCGKRFTTHEVIETVPIVVVKRDKSREVFDRNKLTAGILRACEKRPVSLKQIEQMVDRIEAKIQSMLDREITHPFTASSRTSTPFWTSSTSSLPRNNNTSKEKIRLAMSRIFCQLYF